MSNDTHPDLPVWNITREGVLKIPVTLRQQVSAESAEGAAEAFTLPLKQDIRYWHHSDSTIQFTEPESYEAEGPLTPEQVRKQELQGKLSDFDVLEAEIDGVTYAVSKGQVASFSESHEKEAAHAVYRWLNITVLPLGDMDAAWEQYLDRLITEGHITKREVMLGDIDEEYLLTFFSSPECLTAAAAALKQ